MLLHCLPAINPSQPAGPERWFDNGRSSANIAPKKGAYQVVPPAARVQITRPLLSPPKQFAESTRP